MSGIRRTIDWGHVIVVNADAYGARDAMLLAQRHLTAGGRFATAEPRRARITFESPDPEDWPSTFEVLVTVTP